MSSAHRFGELLAIYRRRKPNLSQNRLAELTGFDNAILVRMSQGKKDLTGPSGRDRIIRILGTLLDEGISLSLAEANALLASADLPPLYAGLPVEAALIRRLDQSAKPIGTVEKRRNTNVLPALTSFVGRERELSQLSEELHHHRLITLVGAGGIGKTRLAIEVVNQILLEKLGQAEGFDAIWFVEFAPLLDPDLVPQTLANVLSLSTGDAQNLLDGLVASLGKRKTLVIFDNCEHLVVACARLTEYLLQRCPDLRFLATSREALRVPGEFAFQVGPLSLPDIAPDGRHDATAYAAVQLFIARMSMTTSNLPSSQPLTENQLRAIAQICRQLDGMPLALELCAALVQVLPIEQIPDRLDNRFNLLVSGMHNAVPRHRTLRDAIAWSYSLLSGKEKRLFAYLSQFQGGWMTDAAEYVCSTTDGSPDNSLSRETILALLGELINKSLVFVEPRKSHTRYRMLETIREFALEQFADIGDAEQMNLQQRHLDFYISLMDCAWPTKDPERQAWLERIGHEQDNFRRALTWALEHDRLKLAVQLVIPLAEYWRISSKMSEGYEQLHKVLARCNPNERTSTRATLLIYTAITQWRFNNQALHLLNEALEISTELNDTNNMVHALVRLGNAAYLRRDRESELKYYQQAIAILEKSDNRLGVIGIKEILADIYVDTGRPEIARTIFEECLQVYAEFNLSNTHNGWALKGLGQVSLMEGKQEAALQLFKRALEQTINAGVIFNIPLCISRIAAVAVMRGDYQAAAKLFGIEDYLIDISEIPDQEHFREVQEEGERKIVHERLEESLVNAAYAEGFAMTDEQGIAYALAFN